MNHSHAGVTLPLPIGMVAAPGAGGPVSIGIGVPIMAAAPLVPPPPPPLVSTNSAAQQTIVSPDSTEDKLHSLPHNHRPSSPSPPHCGSTPWSNPMLQPIPGMAYSVLGMGVMGPPPPPVLAEPNLLYGIMSATNGAEMNHPHGHAAVVNVPNPTSTIPGSSNPPTLTVAPVGSMVNVSGASLTSSPNGQPTIQQQPMKEIFHCKSCTLFPPNPSAPPPTTRDKPPGCRTVFVGGLPENITDEIIREVFERCGEITTIRMSKKNFCHIRFELESFVENAIYLSGYRVRIGSNSDAANAGRLHVDYAQARDDLYEWECRQRQLLREQRHRERIEQERLIPPSPPPIVHYSDHEAINIAEKLKDENFMKAVQVLITWLERGDCCKRTSTTFYSMIQSTNSHVRRLLNEKSQYDEEMQKAKEAMSQRMQGLLIQFCQIEKVFIAACHKKVWDHFTKAQRKNIDVWRKQATEIKSIQLEEALNERTDEEMDMSDIESDSEENGNCIPKSKKLRLDENKTVEQLKEENDSLRCQLEASKNEVDLIKADLKAELDMKEQQLRALQQQLVGSRNSPTSTSSSALNGSGGESATRSRIPCVASVVNGLSEISKEVDSSCDSSSNANILQNNQIEVVSEQGSPPAGPDGVKINDREARLLGIISTFLHVHPFGASLDYIWSYAQKVIPSIRPNQLEALMLKFPSLFKQQMSGVGATLERKWVFVGFV